MGPRIRIRTKMSRVPYTVFEKLDIIAKIFEIYLVYEGKQIFAYIDWFLQLY